MSENIKELIDFLKNENKQDIEKVKSRMRKIALLERELENNSSKAVRSAFNEFYDINIPFGIYGENKVKVTKHTKHSGMVFLYSVTGELLKSFDNSVRAAEYCKENYKQNFIHSYIGYASIGKHNWDGNHKYKNLIWFCKELNNDEVQRCKEIKLFEG